MTTDARRILLERLIDDAGIFPPERLAMPAALAAHAANRVGPLAWIQGRFICPASRLGEIGPAWPEGLSSLRLSIVCDGAGQTDADGFAAALAADLEAAAAAERADARLRIEVVEVRIPDPTVVPAVPPAVRAAGFAGPVTPFAEAPDSTDPEVLTATVAGVAEARAVGAMRLGAKIRCGGLEEAMIPAPETVAAFLAAAVAAGVPFKATAGLHHPVRGVDPASGMLMHGFVNLLAATALLRAGLLEDAGEVVAEGEGSAFTLVSEGIGWGTLRAETAELSPLRDEALTAYGSCSFDEPTGDLAAQGWLP